MRKTPHSSAWTYSHELGRRHLEQTFPNEVTTVSYENITEKNIASAWRKPSMRVAILYLRQLRYLRRKV